MKKNIITLIVMVALLTTTFLTGCGDNKETNTGATTKPTVVSTEATTTPTELETEDETIVPTEKATESKSKSDKADAKDNKDEEDNQNGGSTTTTSNKNSSSGGSSSVTNTNKSNGSSSSSSSSSSNKNNSSSSNSSSSSSSSNSNKKPSSGSNSSSNSNSGSSSSNTKPAPVITDDTSIPHSQLCTDANMQKVTSAVNDYFINLGMIYNPSLNANNSGWFYDCTSRRISECSVNYFKSNVISGFESEANAFLNMCGATYSDLTFYCYAEYQGNGEYNIYFCHE